MTGETIMKIMMKNIRYIFVLTLALLTWGSAWGNTKNSYYYTVTAMVSESGGGKIYVHTGAYNSPANPKAQNVSFQAPTDIVQKNCTVQIESANSATPAFNYVYAQPNNGYRFLGWGGAGNNTDTDAPKLSDALNSKVGNNNPSLGLGDYKPSFSSGTISGDYYRYTTRCMNPVSSSSVKRAASPYILYATFGIPQVNSYDASPLTTKLGRDGTTSIVVPTNQDDPHSPGILISVDGPNFELSAEQIINVSLKNAVDQGDYFVETTGNTYLFSFANFVYAPTPANRRYNQVNQGSIDLAILSSDYVNEQSATLTIYSKYNGSATATSLTQAVKDDASYSRKSYTVYLQANLKPTFSIAESVQDNIVHIGEGSASKDISNFAKDLNVIGWGKSNGVGNSQYKWEATFEDNDPSDSNDDHGSFSIANNGTVSFEATHAGTHTAIMHLYATYKDAEGNTISSDPVDFIVTGNGRSEGLSIEKRDDAVTQNVDGSITLPTVKGTTKATYSFNIGNIAEGTELTSMAWNGDAEYIIQDETSYNKDSRILTVVVRAPSAPESGSATFTTTLSISGGGKDGEWSFSGTILAKDENTLSLKTPFYVYTDTRNWCPVENGNGQDIRITVDNDSYITVSGSTISSNGTKTSNLTEITITQDATDEIKGKEIVVSAGVEKHTVAVSLLPGRVVYPHQSYVNFVMTDNSETILETTVSGDASLDGSTLSTNEIGTLTLRVTQVETENYEALDENISVYVVNNPAHVPVTVNKELFDNSVERVFDGDRLETLLNDFVVSSSNVEWTGDQSINQFTMDEGVASIVFHIAGVPDRLTFSFSHSNPQTRVGELIIEESADGSDWSSVEGGNLSEPKNNVSLLLKPSTRYLRFRSPEANKDYNTIKDLVITEGQYLRFASHYVDYMQSEEGSYSVTIPFEAANWGAELRVDATLPNEKVLITLPDAVATDVRDTYIQSNLSVDFLDGADAAWIKIMRGEQMLDYVRVTALPRFITSDMHDVIYTDEDPKINATEADVARRRRTFEHTFDSEGAPMFDNLYVFGHQRNEDGKMTITGGVEYFSITEPNAVSGSNSVIPCYVYRKDQTNARYVWDHTIDNMNRDMKTGPLYAWGKNIDGATSGAKPVDFHKVTATGQKFYFTGECEYATVGNTTSDEGVVHIKGSSNDHVDIYLENCIIYARKKSNNGSTATPGTYSSSDRNTVTPQGSASVFAFECTDTNSKGFSPSIHIRGNNSLKSNAGIRCSGLDAVQNSSPVEIHITSKNSYTNLVLDDIWPLGSSTNEHTNGILNLKHESTYMININLGNEHGKVTFNGGQYVFEPTYVASSSGTNYKINHSIGCYYVEGSGFTPEYYGAGTSAALGTVIINDGTFKMSAGVTSEKNGLYKDHPYLLRSVTNTQINGGSFIHPIIACLHETDDYPGQMILNKYGDNLEELTLDAVNVLPNGVAEVQLPTEMAAYYTEKADPVGYGVNSINADNQGKVTVMLPAKKLDLDEKRGYTRYPWLFVAPALQAKYGLAHIDLCKSEVKAPNTEKDIISNMLYLEVDENTKQQLQDYPVTIDNKFNVGVSVVNEKYASVSNTTDYTIRKNITMMIPIVADHWYTFTAPFDINSVSIMEINSESVYQGIADDDDGGLTDALNQQALDYVEWFSVLASNTYEGEISSFSIHCKVSTFQELWSQFQKTHANATIEPLKAFKNQNDWTANYFLYEPSTDGSTRSDYWNWTADGPVVNWIPAQPTTDANGNQAIMARGRTYAMQFPYCPGCQAAIEAQGGVYQEEWDYWTGKYLVLEGTGPQTIWGSNSLRDNELAPFNTANQAAFRGNASFGKTTVTNSNVYYHNEEENEYKDYFVNTSNYVAKPGQGFLLVNPNQPAAGAPARSFVFQAPNTNATVNGATGIPTISASQWRGLNPTGAQATKVLINDQIYILRGNKLYDIHGRDVK